MPRKLEHIENPIEKEKRLIQSVSFSERYEDELKEKLFAEDDLPKEVLAGDYLTATKFVHHERPDEEWDVPLTEEIKYFDGELSYELTKYKPITMEKGLDFDPDWFREDAMMFEKEGVYTKYPPGCKPYREFWNERYRRCKEGFESHGYRITGDHYFFINFYRMFTINEGSVAGTGRNESFPAFLSKQYELFHYIEMCEKLHKDIALLKGRGIGASEMLASLAVRPYTTNRGYYTMLTCVDDKKLSPLKGKCWKQLDWLNMNTQGGFRHLRQVYNNDDKKQASLKSPDGTAYGWGSTIEAVIANDPQKIRGDRLDRLIYDEAGSWADLTECWIRGDSLVSLGGEHFGVKLCAGTGGDDMSIGGLSSIFTSPEAYNVLPFKNYDTDDGNPELSGFFIPSHKFALKRQYLDSRGVTDHIEFKKYYEKLREKLTDKDYLNEAAEHCFTPREALSKHGDNVFDTAVLSDRMIQIKIHGQYTKPIRTQLLWDRTVGDGYNKVTAYESASSNLFVVEPPMVDETGNPYKDLYVAGIDAIDMGRKDSATDSDVSDFCIIVYKRNFGMSDPRIVAMYKYRPNDIRQAYDISMKLCVWYNCKALLEYTKISIQTYFREKGKANLLMRRPKAVMTGQARPGKTLVGVPATENVIRHGLELVNNFVTDYWYTIDFEEIVDQLINYSYENKRKFDIIASLQMCMLADEELTGATPKSVNSASNDWKDFGWYRDENGYKRYGVIPK